MCALEIPLRGMSKHEKMVMAQESRLTLHVQRFTNAGSLAKPMGVLIGLFVLAATLVIGPQSVLGAGGGGGGGCTPTSCDAPTPACDQTTTGTDNCGNSCSKTGAACCTVTSCDAPTPACDQTTTGTNNCGKSCSKIGAACCTATTCSAPAPSCGQTTWGTNDCGKSCSKIGPACAKQPYGFVVPSDPRYGFYFNQSSMDHGLNMWSNNRMTSVGLAAKGNIVIGDYTTDAFKSQVVPKLRADDPDTVTQPYVVDPTDELLGYDSKNPSLCSGKFPCFDGNYDHEDGGQKLDGSPRKFYESTLPDDEFRALVDPKLRTSTAPLVQIDAVLFTNHALAGLVNAQKLKIDGAIVARDDGLLFGNQLEVNHDIRLVNGVTATGLPMSIKRPKLIRFEECPPAGCPE